VDGSVSVLFFNRGSSPAPASAINLADLPGAGWNAGVQVATVRDVWAKADLNKATGGKLSSGMLPAHGVAFLRVTKA